MAVSYGYGVWPANYVYSSYAFDTGYETVAFPLLGFNQTVSSFKLETGPSAAFH